MIKTTKYVRKQHTTHVLALPPRLDASKRVNLLFRNGIKFLPLPLLNSWMTLLNVNKLLLMEEPSFNRLPLAPVFLALEYHFQA